MYKTIEIEHDDYGVVRITLNRPEVHNAFDEIMISELHRVVEDVETTPSTRIVVFKANGKSFSAGADLKWMRRAADFSEQENYNDAMALAELLRALDALSKPTVAFVQGAAFGGGVGLLSCCDIVIALDAAVFSLSEVRLGLVPAVISPYVVRAIGARAARRYFQSGERFDCTEAHRIGLVHSVAESEDALTEVIDSLLRGGPQAQHVSKELIAGVVNRPITREMIENTAHTIAKVRVSDEGQEGLSAFFEKRNSGWHKQS